MTGGILIPRDIYTFFIIAASITMFSAYGVITSPDAPLLFFTALFLFFLQEISIRNELVCNPVVSSLNGRA